jgi:hypothetical protein
MKRIIVCGYMIRHPVAGNLLAYFHYLLGLTRLGYEVVYLEESGWPESCYNPVSRCYSNDPQKGMQVVRGLIENYDLDVSLYYLNRDTGAVYGADWPEVKQMLKTADLLLNIGGVCWLPEFLLCDRRILIDLDPFFSQIGKFGAEGRDNYHAYFSYGVNLGRSDCTIPQDGKDWQPTVPPVVPEIWSKGVSPQRCGESEPPETAAFTTIANWNAYGGVTYQGQYYGQKDREFLSLLELPKHCHQKLELALSGANRELQEWLQKAGWVLRDAGEISANLLTYQAYIANSKGEFSAAKNAYVKTRSGWFSDRSVCYLAAGRPVVLQDTGFSEWLPTGKGVLAFSCLEEAANCLGQVDFAYREHCRAAREIAEETFSYRRVLPRILAAI